MVSVLINSWLQVCKKADGAKLPRFVLLCLDDGVATLPAACLDNASPPACQHLRGKHLDAAGARTRCRLRAAGAAPPRPKCALPAISTVKQTWLG